MQILMISIGLALLVVCSIVIAKACDLFESSADYLGRRMEDGVKGATINAIASSMPELLTTVFFLWFADIDKLGYNLAASISGDAGSAIFNSIIIPVFVILVVIRLGISAGANVSKKVILRDGLFLIAAELLLLVLLSTDVIKAAHGVVLVVFYLMYLTYTLRSMKKSETTYVEFVDDHENLKEEHGDVYKYAIKMGIHIDDAMRWSAITMLTVAVLVISAACAGLVHATEMISTAMNINMMFVALVLVAAASSVPDTIISIRDAKKGNHDDALANVWGSNIFDITISMGLPLAAYLWITGYTIDFTEASASLVDLRLVLLLVTILTVGVFYFSKKMAKPQIYMLVALYAAFLTYCIGGAFPNTGVGQEVTLIKELLHTHIEPILKQLNSYIPF